MKAYLAVKLSEGMFSGENSVWIEDYTGTATFGFFEKRYIKDGRLEVEVLQEKGDSVFVKLPGRTMEAPGDKEYLTVRKEDLVYEIQDNNRSMEEAAEHARKTIASWPKWKQEMKF